MLALEINTLVPTARLVDLVWPDNPPASARRMIHTYISALRSVLSHTSAGEVSLLGHPAGYELRCGPTLVDAHHFLALIAQARTSDGDEQRLAILDQALGLWQGPSLAGVTSEDLRIRLCHHLDQARLTATEDHAEALLRLGRHHEMVDKLTALSAEHPTRQRLIRQLMLALHRTGRTADALHTYEQARRHLADELGIDPNTELQNLHRSLLRGDLDQLAPARRVPAPGAVARRRTGVHRPYHRADPARPVLHRRRAGSCGDLCRVRHRRRGQAEIPNVIHIPCPTHVAAGSP